MTKRIFIKTGENDEDDLLPQMEIRLNKLKEHLRLTLIQQKSREKVNQANQKRRFA